jgi:hypothetical protein
MGVRVHQAREHGNSAEIHFVRGCALAAPTRTQRHNTAALDANPAVANRRL